MNMTEGKIFPIFIKFSLPLLFGNIFQLCYSMTDSFIVGNYCGSLSLAAIGASGNIIFTVTGFFTGLANGAGVVISQAFGSKDEYKFLSSVHTMLAFSLLLSLVLTLFGIYIAPIMLRMISVPSEVFLLANTYLRIYFSGIIFILIYNVCAAILRALGESKQTLFILIISVVLNIFLDYFFILILKKGLGGAAIATVISESFSALTAFIVLLWQLQKISFIPNRKIKKYFSLFALIPILKIGLPGAVSSLLLNFSNTFMQRYINQFGAECMAGWAVYARFDELSLLPMVSICMAAMTFTGQNYGAGKMERVHRGIKVSVTLGLIVTGIIASALICSAPLLISIFNSEGEVVRYGAQFIRASASFYLFCFGTMIVCQVSQGLGHSAIPTLIIFSGFVVLRQTYLFVITHLIVSSIAVALAYPLVWPPTLLVEILYLRKKLQGLKKDI